MVFGFGKKKVVANNPFDEEPVVGNATTPDGFKDKHSILSKGKQPGKSQHARPESHCPF